MLAQRPTAGNKKETTVMWSFYVIIKSFILIQNMLPSPNADSAPQVPPCPGIGGDHAERRTQIVRKRWR